MQDKRCGSMPSAQTQPIEQAIFNLLLAEDHPWRLEDLQRELGRPACLVLICVERLKVDGLVEQNGETVRASRAAIRAEELAI